MARIDSNFTPAIDSEVGGYALLGMEIGRGRSAWVAEVFYRDVEFTLDLREIGRPEIFDIPLSGVGVNFGIVFRSRR